MRPLIRPSQFSLKSIRSAVQMSRRERSLSTPSSPREAKRPRLEVPLTSEDYKNGIMLAPMVRSGALPTRLFSLKYGASLVWGPEIVDKAILHAERVVDPATGVVNYNGKSRAIWSTHPIEKPYLIYQIGSADPELAVKAAKAVMNDVSGIDLNCGCPKPFSTSGGMGAALLTNPDLLCSILTALRNAMPPEISVSAKIRLLPTQEDTLKLVERIINTGVSALTVHCRTRNMRKTEKATIERLREVVEFVEKMGKGVAIIENGDCLGYEDSKRVREVTGAHSVMIATAAEANPSCFSPTPLVDVHRTLVPTYLRVSRYLGNHWGNSKFCGIQFRGGHVECTRAEEKEFKDRFAKAKCYDDMNDVAGDWSQGKADFEEICHTIEARPQRTPRPIPTTTAIAEDSNLTLDASDAVELSEESQVQVGTPKEWRPNPYLDDVLNTPKIPTNPARIPIPAAVSGVDEPTPTPSPLVA